MILPTRSISGSLKLPGDKSISHRCAILGAIAEGHTQISNYSSGADCISTLACLREMGVSIEGSDTSITITGLGINGLKPPIKPLDAGNSGSTIRMLSGILAGQPFETVITGDESLTKRPMQRIITPLEEMGAKIEPSGNGLPPLKIHGGSLKPIDYELTTPSAQVKTAVLFAGLYTKGITSVREPVPTRNHTEIALLRFGGEVRTEGKTISIKGCRPLTGQEVYVPADLSSAAFFIAAALLLPGSHLILEDVGLNPTRTAFIDLLREMGADIKVLSERTSAGETIGNIEVVSHAEDILGALRGGVIEGEMTTAVIDELPILAVLGAVSEQGLTIRNAEELRVKETDRIATIADNLTQLGVSTEIFDDGLKIPGRNHFRAAELNSFGDHRIAMAFTVAALRAEGPCSMVDAEAAAVSLPEFYSLLNSVAVT
jgi:3-phosphoshikimate 1-carboxyvinyltransferase